MTIRPALLTLLAVMLSANTLLPPGRLRASEPRVHLAIGEREYSSRGTAAGEDRFIYMRIIGGQLKGRAIMPPPNESITRPITGLVKKSLFGMLGEDLSPYAIVLDLYCGTGTLGIEALSRGAGLCCFAEYDRRVVGRLKRNLDDLRLTERSRLWVGDITARLAGWLDEVGGKVDLAFVDPPYEHARQWDWPTAEQTIFSPLAAHLASDGVVTLRLPAEVEVPQKLGPLAVVRRRVYGDMGLLLLQLAE